MLPAVDALVQVLEDVLRHLGAVLDEPVRQCDMIVHRSDLGFGNVGQILDPCEDTVCGWLVFGLERADLWAPDSCHFEHKCDDENDGMRGKKCVYQGECVS